MTTHDTATLIKLSETHLMVAMPDEDIRHRKVIDKDGKEIGKIEDLMIDQPHRKVRFLVVESGGFLGMGEKKTLIPVDAITRMTDTEVQIDQTHEHVSGAPAYDPSLTTERTYYGDVYSHYGHTPYWTSGYMYPSYPFYPV